jgi:hypothetical protein
MMRACEMLEGMFTRAWNASRRLRAATLWVASVVLGNTYPQPVDSGSGKMRITGIDFGT